MSKNISKKIVRKVLTKFFKKKLKFYSMETVESWDSLNHLKLMIFIQNQFSIKLTSKDISNLTDEKKILKILVKKIK